MKQYVSVPAPAGSEVRYPFRLDGVVYTAVSRPADADFAMAFSEIAADAVRVAGSDLMSPEGVAFTSRFFRLMLGAEYEAFTAHLGRFRPKSELLAEIVSDLSAWAQQRQEDEAGRPTMPSGSSSGGRLAGKADRVSRLASMAGADADIIVISPDQAQPPAGRRTAASRPKRGRRSA